MKKMLLLFLSLFFLPLFAEEYFFIESGNPRVTYLSNQEPNKVMVYAEKVTITRRKKVDAYTFRFENAVVLYLKENKSFQFESFKTEFISSANFYLNGMRVTLEEIIQALRNE